MDKFVYLVLSDDWIREKDIISIGSHGLYENSNEYIVRKVYRYQWWKRFLMKFGFSFRINQIKIERYG